MSKGYWISAYHSIHDADALAAYAKLAAPAITAAGGRFLVRGMPVAVKEHGIEQRTVIVEFDSVDAALAAYNSAPYQEALVALGANSVVRDLRILPGV
jgi:uncharacterized protein (DUF1330 family)